MLRFYAQRGLSTIIINFDEDLGGSWHQRIKNLWCYLSVWIKGGVLFLMSRYTLVKIIITFLYNFHISPLTNNPSSPSLPAYPNMWDLWHHDTKWQYKYCGSVNDKENEHQHPAWGTASSWWERISSWLLRPVGTRRKKPSCANKCLIVVFEGNDFQFASRCQGGWGVDILFSVSVGLSCHVIDCVRLSGFQGCKQESGPRID